MDPENAQKELLSEKNLAQVYVLTIAAVRKTSTRSLYRWFLVECIAATGAAVYAYLSNDPSQVMSAARRIADTAFNFTYQVFGILLAGFAIFQSLTTSRLGVEMALRTEPKTAISYLKLNIAHFMYVFVQYFLFMAYYFVLSAFAWEGNPVVALVNRCEHARIIFRLGTGLWLVATIVGFAHLLVILQAFLFNVYHSVMTSVAWAVEEDAAAKLKAASHESET